MDHRFADAGFFDPYRYSLGRRGKLGATSGGLQSVVPVKLTSLKNGDGLDDFICIAKDGEM